MVLMGAIVKSRKYTLGKALLSIYETQDIMREDQKLFHKTVSDLKKKVISTPNELKAHTLGNNGQ